MKRLIDIGVIILLSGCSTFPQAVKPVEDTSPAQHDIYIVSHGWHTGIIVPAADINVVLPSLSTRFKQALWYEVGWGDKGFYQAKEITSKLTLQAMFWSSGAVMHVVAFSDKPRHYFATSDIQQLTLNSSQHLSLMRYIGRSFVRNETGNPIPLKKGIYGDSQFYAANGRYGILNTCNKWTAKGLQSAGMPIDPALKLTAGSVMRAVHKNSECLNRYCYVAQ